MIRDVMEIQEIVSLVKDALSIVSGIILTTIAFLGLQTWKKQLKGNTEYNLARRFLRRSFRPKSTLDSSASRGKLSVK